MASILLLVSTEEDGNLPKVALEAASAAKELGQSPMVAAVFGSKANQAVSQLAGAGFDKALVVEDPSLEKGRYASDVAAAEVLAHAAGSDVVLVPATARMQRIVAGLTRRLGGKVDTHLTALAVEEGQVVATRWYYRQRLIAKIKRSAKPWVLSLDAGCWSPWKAEGTLKAETVEFKAPQSRTVVEGLKSSSSGAQTIRPDAQLLFVAGAGWTKKQPSGDVRLADAEKTILGFLDKSQASLGGSKAVVDLEGEGACLSFMSHLNQIGQTGATPRHPKGLATCCHGEEPHVVGWRFINERRAVNLNPSCSWAQGKTDVLYVADAFEVMAKVNEFM